MNRRLETQQASEDSELGLHKLLEDLEVGVAVVGPRTEARLFNRAALELLGLSAEQLLGRTAFDPAWNIIHEDGSPFRDDEHPSARAIATKLPVRNVVAGVLRPSKGDRKWLLCNAVPHLAADRSVSEVLCSFSDISELKSAEEAMLAAHEALKDQGRILDLAHDAIITRSLEGKIAYWNEGAVRKYGWGKVEAIGKNTHELLRTEFPESGEELRQRLLKDGYWEGELVHTRRDGKRITVASRQVLERRSDGQGQMVLEINRDITDKKEMEQKLRESEQALRELSGNLLKLQDADRRRVARELHDSTSPPLTALTSRLHAARHRASSLDAGTLRFLDESLKLADETSNVIRNVSDMLHPPLLDEKGLLACLRWYLNDVAKRTGTKVEARLPEELKRASAEAEIAAFRLIQHCVSDVFRYDRSRAIKLGLTADREWLTIEVAVESREPTPELQKSLQKETAGLGPGLAGMQERMRQLGGRLETVSTNFGVTFLAALPLKP